jgi:hypothetical protein
MKNSRSRTSRISTDASGKTPLSANHLVQDFTHRLMAVMESATIELGEAMIANAFSAVAADANLGLGKAAKKQADRDRNQIVATLTQRFLNVIEELQRARIGRALERASAAVSRSRTRERMFPSPESDFGSAAPVRRRTRRVRPNPHLPPPLDPEQIKRDQEFARLRALLKPVELENTAPAPVPVVVAPPVQSIRPASPGDVLRALEKEIQNAVPTLGTLGIERCSAQIAAWAGQVRGLRDRLPPDVAAAMRPAFRIFLEHLTQLRIEMEAHVVDALEPNWKSPDWDAYVEANRARAEQRPPVLSSDRLQIHHRSMLRALVLPHRRNVPEHAVAIINAAAEALHPEDSLLQSAIRRHSSVRKSQTMDAIAEPLAAETSADIASIAPSAGEAGNGATAEAPAQATTENDRPLAPVTSDNEFDSLWTK